MVILMKILGFIGCWVLILGCQPKTKTNELNYPISNAEEWLNGDENFGYQQKSNSRKLDTAILIYSLKGDLNNDGIIDTANAITNSKNRTTKITFTCFKSIYINAYTKELVLTDAGDMNGDGKHEILVLQPGEESCWDNLKLFSLNTSWVEKYSGTNYQCSEKPTYSFTKLNSKTLQLITFGNSKDSIDISTGDTLEQILPNEQQVHLIKF